LDGIIKEINHGIAQRDLTRNEKTGRTFRIDSQQTVHTVN